MLALPGHEAALLALSSDSGLLAAASGNVVHIYSTQQLMAGAKAPLAERQLPGTVVQLAWRPGPAASEFAALLADGSLLLARLASSDVGAAALAPAPPGQISCLAWSPDGSRLAVGAADQVLVYAAPGGGSDSWRQTAAVRVRSLEIQEEEGMSLEVDSLSWVAPSTMLVSSKLLASDGAEEPFAPLCTLSWRAGTADPTADTLELAGACLLGSFVGAAGISLPEQSSGSCCAVVLEPFQYGTHQGLLPCCAEFFASNIDEVAAAQGPWLQAVTLPQVLSSPHELRVCSAPLAVPRAPPGVCSLPWACHAALCLPVCPDDRTVRRICKAAPVIIVCPPVSTLPTVGRYRVCPPQGQRQSYQGGCASGTRGRHCCTYGCRCH